MWRNLIDVHLLIAIIYVGWLIVAEKETLAPINEDLNRLQAIVGELRIVNPDNIYVAAIATGRPLEFMWRIYLPRGYEPRHETQFVGLGGGGSSSRSSPLPPPREFILWAQIRVDSEILHFQSRSDGAGHQSGTRLTDSTESRFIRQLIDNPSRAIIKQAGAGNVQEFTTNDEIKLLSISVKPEDEAGEAVEVFTYKYLSPSATVFSGSTAN